MSLDLNLIKEQTNTAFKELIELSHIKKGEILVVGCSSSEIIGERIGSIGSPEVADVLVSEILPLLNEKGIFLAAQCCEHLNRALIVEREVAENFGFEIVSVLPATHAGGSFATAVFEKMSDPVAVEFISAKAGIDIGGTLIGMHIKHVAVPLRIKTKKIGEANILTATSRPKLIGGERAIYFSEKMKKHL